MRGLTGSLSRVTAEMPTAAGRLATKAQGAETRAHDVQASLAKILAVPGLGLSSARWLCCVIC